METSRVRILASCRIEPTGKIISLRHHTAGAEIAGSGTRITGEKWTVAYELRDGTNGSRAFKTEDEARAEFNRCSVPGA